MKSGERERERREGQRHGQCGQQGGRQTGTWAPLTLIHVSHTRHIPVSQGLIKLICPIKHCEKWREIEREGQLDGQDGQQGGRQTGRWAKLTGAHVLHTRHIPVSQLLIKLICKIKHYEKWREREGQRHGQYGQQGGRQTGRWAPLTVCHVLHIRHIPVSQGLIKLRCQSKHCEKWREREREG